MSTRYRADRVQVVRKDVPPRAASWTFAGATITGYEYTYEVIDRNYKSRNQWEFVVRVPNRRAGRIEVRPTQVANRSVWAVLDRRSLTFARAAKPNYRGKLYCPIALADPTGEKTRMIVSSSERQDLPYWFDQFKSRIHAKETVQRTEGNDQQSLVAVVSPEDHEQMVRLFFATKVWPLAEGFVLKGRAA